MSCYSTEDGTPSQTSSSIIQHPIISFFLLTEKSPIFPSPGIDDIAATMKRRANN